MSVQALSCAMAVRGVSASEKLLLLVLANYADEHMRSFPSHSRLAGDTGLSERTILTLMKGLESRLMLSRTERRRRDGSRSSDVITLHFGGEVVSPRGEDVAPGVGKSTTGGGEVVSPLTTFEPSLEEPSLDEPPTGAEKRALRGSSADFERFWTAYPRKTAKATARKAFPAALANCPIETMIAALDRQREWDQWRRNVIPHPATWLRGSRWADEDPPQTPVRLIHERQPPTDAKFAAKQANYARAWEGSERAIGRDWDP